MCQRECGLILFKAMLGLHVLFALKLRLVDFPCHNQVHDYSSLLI